MSTSKTHVAILGSGNIGTDLMLKILGRSDALEIAMMVGIDPESDGLANARKHGIRTTDRGIAGLIEDACWEDVEVVFDATSARAHLEHAKICAEHDKRVVDLTPAAVGPYVVPVANLDEHIGAPNVNMVTCGGQATIPIVWAINRAQPVHYAEIVASIASRSAGPGTRANIDEFTRTTSRGIEVVGGAKRGKAIIILNPAEPPMIMRDTVYAFCPADEAQSLDREKIRASIEEVVARVREYVPGYRLVQAPVFEEHLDEPLSVPGDEPMRGTLISCFLEIEGAGDYLPKYAGNLDIMTSAALRMGELIAEQL
jgi:acetaldehyde dehydrogenase